MSRSDSGMDNKDNRFQRQLALLVLASFLVFALASVLQVGMDATPYETTDGAGRPMGFNDSLHAEHLLIMLRNFRPTELLKLEHAYEWVLLCAHSLGAWILLSRGRVSARVRKRFFVAQVALFPLGILALPIFAHIVWAFLTGRVDREVFVDMPFIPLVAQPVWVITALIIVIALPKQGKELSSSPPVVTQ